MLMSRGTAFVPSNARPGGKRRRPPRARSVTAALSLVLLLFAGCGPSGPTGAPPSPREVLATPIPGGVRVTWIDQSSNEDGFIVLRKLAGEEGQPSTEVGTVGTDEQSFDDFSTEPDAEYVYGVLAVNVVGPSDVAVQGNDDPVVQLPGVDVSLTFDGAGTVTISGGGVLKVCVTDCIVSFGEGTDITLNAQDSEGAVFAGWAGDCAGAGTCAVEVDGPLEVEARFRRHVLQLSLAGDSPVELTMFPADDFGTNRCVLDAGAVCALAYGFAGPLAVSINAVKLDPAGQFIGFDGPCSTEQGTYCLANVSGATPVAVSVVHPPVASADAFGTNEDTALDVGADAGVLANDTDTEGDELSAVLVTGPANGELQLRPNGSFEYSPDQDYAGSDAFEYLVRDAYGNESGTVTVSLTVRPVNDPPVFDIEDTEVNVSGAPQVHVIPNFVTGIGPGGGPDEAGQTLTIDVTKRPGGVIMLQDAMISLNGTLTFTPTPGVHGQATYEVTIADNGGTANGGQDESAVKTFTINVGPEHLTLEITGDGNVAANPASEDGNYGYGTTVTLSATAGEDHAFGVWGGDCTGGNATCQVVMDAERTVSARFDPVVSVEFAPGTYSPVSSSPAGISSCYFNLGTCQASFGTGTLLTLAVHVGTYTFGNVTCQGPQTAESCTFTVSEPITVLVSN